jgi:DNA-binding NarL/FixJ family response regulator
MKTKRPTRKILDRRTSAVWQLAYEGYSDKDISEILNNLDRTWVYRLRKRMPKSWSPKFF